jgi:hypothetical protein
MGAMKDALRVAWLVMASEGRLIWISASVRALMVLFVLLGVRATSELGEASLFFGALVPTVLVNFSPLAARYPVLPASPSSVRAGRALGVWAPAALGLTVGHLLLALWPTEALALGRSLTAWVWPGSPDALWPWLLAPEAVHVVDGGLVVDRGPSPLFGLSLLLGLGLALQAGDLRLYAPAARHHHSEGSIFGGPWGFGRFLLHGAPWGWAVMGWHTAPWTTAGLLLLLMLALLLSARLRPWVGLTGVPVFVERDPEARLRRPPERRVSEAPGPSRGRRPGASLSTRPFRAGAGAWARDVVAAWARVARMSLLILVFWTLFFIIPFMGEPLLLGMAVRWMVVGGVLVGLVVVPIFGALAPAGLPLDTAGAPAGSAWDLLPVSRVRVLGVSLISASLGVAPVLLAARFTPAWVSEGAWQLAVGMALVVLTGAWSRSLRVLWVRDSQLVLATALWFLLSWVEPQVADRLLVLQALLALLVGAQALWRRP